MKVGQEPMFRGLSPLLRATNPAGFMQAARFIAEAEMPPLAAGLTMPVLMIQGDEDRVARAATNAELLAAALPHARLVMLAGCGHLPQRWSRDRRSASL
jgi:pimeloyl-ACP methyl ester carboxylesterase